MMMVMTVIIQEAERFEADVPLKERLRSQSTVCSRLSLVEILFLPFLGKHGSVTSGCQTYTVFAHLTAR